MSTSQSYSIPFLFKEKLTKDIYRFYFKRPKKFDFKAGAYNRWTLPLVATDKKGSSRFFTISSSPLDQQYLIVTTKIGTSDFKKALMQLNKNDEIRIFGPMGNFVLNEKETKSMVFLAGGISITPFYSMLHYAARKKMKTSLTLFVSFSTPEEMIFYDELKKLEEKNKNIKIIYTITNIKKTQTRWQGERGKISENLIKKHVSNLNDVLFYIVGTPTMEEETTTLLRKMKIKEENILTEEFTGY